MEVGISGDGSSFPASSDYTSDPAMSTSNTNTDENIGLPPHFNLTGQVEIQGYTPDFRGNYSSVYRGFLNGKFVAVKIIQATGEPEAMKRKVLRERVVWGSTNHPNIHPFYGHADDPAFGPFGALVSPWSAKGDANRFLKENGDRMILAERINLACALVPLHSPGNSTHLRFQWKGVIEGVLYLHDQTPPIVHGDLKPGNILINDFGVPTICDFGLARIFLEQGGTGLTTTSEHTGTTRYLAPELVASDTTVYPTLASDVYALGCLGLDFVYLQQPFSNHPNNLRGRIFRDLRRGLPPAIERPPQAWPSIRVWPIIIKCWNSDHHSRLSALAAGRMLRRTTLTFPTIAIKRIAHFVDITWSESYRFIRSLSTWKQRCQCLRHLCLVSKAYRECVTPFLYRDIRLVLNDGWHLSTLISVLEGSATKSPFFPLEPAGYGSYIKSISLRMELNGMRHSDVAIGVRNLADRLPGLRLIRIHPFIFTDPILELPSLTTLALEQVGLAILFDHRATLQALESLQCLSIRRCEDIASFSRPFRELLPGVYLPNLLEIAFYGDDSSKPFTTISTWTMPRLRSLDFRDFYDATSPLLDFFKLLSTHGPQLQSLTLTSSHLREQDISTLLALCSGLLSLDIDSRVSPFVLSASHARLETIRLHWRVESMTDSRMNVVVDALKSLRTNPRTSFPKLIEAEFVVAPPIIGMMYRYRDMTASFRTADAFITARNKGKTYRLFDGQADLVGASFGHAVDCTDSNCPRISIHSLRGTLMMVDTLRKKTKEDIPSLYLYGGIQYNL